MSQFKQVLVTGGAGFIGSQLVRDLLLNGYAVKVIDDFSTGCEENLDCLYPNEKVCLLKGNILNSDTALAAVRDCDAVFHLAVSNLRVSIKNPFISHDVNATGTISILEACRQLGVERFVYVSSSEVYGSAVTTPMNEAHPVNPTTVYASSKLAGELYTRNYAKMYGMKCTIVRPFNNYGPRSHFEKENGEIIPRSVVRLLNGLPPLIFGDGLQTRDFIYVTDTTKALVNILENFDESCEIYNVSSGNEISVKSLCIKLCEMISPDQRPIFLPIERPGEVKRHFADNTKIKNRFAVKLGVSLDEGIRLYLRWFKEQYPVPSVLLDRISERNW